ncbi:MAG TPA: EamA family transporter [Streptosporangiaceae bacterium]|nr:EamA family transporter [Streptosporangiaceae bacterium]
MTYGLLAALCWGVATLAAALAARRIGAFRTVIVGEATGLTGYGVIFAADHFSLRGTGPAAWLLLLAGVIGVGGYLSLYRGLETAHVGLVSAISACYGGVIVVLSVLLLGERLTVAAASGVMLTVAGVVLTAGRAAPSARQAARATGVAFGLAAALCYGVSGFLLGRYAQDLGWLVPVVVARSGAMILLLGLLATPLRHASPRDASPRDAAGSQAAGSQAAGSQAARTWAARTLAVPGVAWAVAAGLADAAGLIFFARGGQAGLVAITAAVSSAYPVIPLLGGLVLLRERLAGRQAGGAALILAGLVLLGLGS